MKQFFFILQNGWRQIVLPNGEVVNINTCKDGVFITIEENLDKVVEQLNEFKGYEIVKIHCDSNEITKGFSFVDAEIVDHEGRRSIYLRVKSVTGDNCIVDII